MAGKKIKCKPERPHKSGPKTVSVKSYKRSKPKPIKKKCK